MAERQRDAAQDNALQAMKQAQAQAQRYDKRFAGAGAAQDWGAFNLGNALKVANTNMPVTSYTSANLGV